MDILILSAGKTDKTVKGPKSDRPLRGYGRRQAEKIGALLARQDLRPDTILVAPGQRARQTAELALKAAGWTPNGIEEVPSLAHGIMPEIEDTGRTLLVAAPKVTDRLVTSLLPALSGAPGFLTLVTVGQGTMELFDAINPRDLSELFPYPAPDGPDRRLRPAYYYTQSAVIPYRSSQQGTEVLIISSSSGQHWGVPKGIVEPGLTPAVSASLEALEEAGACGHVNDEPLGHYSFEKWGAPCSVTVFPMEVSHMVPNTEWQESHRARRWASKDEAISLLRHTDLHSMVEAL